ncbi:uncharacterized protein PAC_17507 [Phialocephala subalpina]|uniref:Uncharacterized protein n=1 Tax=Phialocephala subalpina TaxID=576137 RepID=A0A1L7XRN3_9HELO|nr:uncharacterized protein PAC_17507 [Phialocephala subalpina]
MTKQEFETQYRAVPSPSLEESTISHQRWSWRSLWPSRNEKSKVAISNSRFRALWRCFVVLSPIPLTLIVLGLNISNYYCFDWGRPNQNSILDALQFFAKVHDLLIAASVTAIILHSVLYHLTMEDGVSLAAITPAYQLSQTSFIFKRAFWIDIFSHGRISLGILITLAVFLINIAGPSAAIAVLPKAGWWPVPPGILWAGSGYNTVGAFYITNSTSVWPTEVSISYLPTDEPAGDCLSSWAIIEESCPAAGYLPVTEALLNDNFQIGGLWNVLLSNRDTSRSLTSIGPAYFDNDFDRKRWSISSSITQIMATSFSNYDENDNYNQTLGFHGTPLLKPLVQVECSVREVVSSTLVFPHDYIPLPGASSSETWAVETSVGWDSVISDRTSDVHFLWASLQNNNSGPSLLAAFNINNTNNAFNYTDSSGASHMGDNQTAFTCSIDARWAPVEMWMFPGFDFDYRVHENSPFDLAGSLDFLGSPDQIPNLEQIQIDPAWAASLNVHTPNSTYALTMEQVVRISESMNADWWSNGTTDEFLNLVAAGMGMMVADGLARLSWSDQLVALASDNRGSFLQNWGTNASLDTTRIAPTINPDWLEMNFASYRQGWSYSLSGVTIRLALGVLALHLVIAVIHTVIVVGSRDVWTTESWGSMGELLVLAINSDRSEKFQNTCAGIDLSRTWRKKLKIREIEQGHLGLVVDNHGDIDDVEQGPTVGGEQPKAVPGRRYGCIRTDYQ